jgi:hypothetical protein
MSNLLEGYSIVAVLSCLRDAPCMQPQHAALVPTQIHCWLAT